MATLGLKTDKIGEPGHFPKDPVYHVGEKRLLGSTFKKEYGCP